MSASLSSLGIDSDAMKWEKMMARKAVEEKGTGIVGEHSADGNESLNSVLLRGRVSSVGVEKILPSEDRVVEFRLVVSRDGRAGVDVLDIGAWNSKSRRRALTLKIDEWVEIEGSIHRRFWQGSQGLASRWQIEASEITRI